MSSRDFCFFLQGFFEITEASGQDEPHKLSSQQVEIIKRHLALVFKHEIEPSMDLSEEEKKIHDGTNVPLASPYYPPYNPWTRNGTIPYPYTIPTIYC